MRATARAVMRVVEKAEVTWITKKKTANLTDRKSVFEGKIPLTSIY
jgi:hypothetical protein